MGNEFAGGRLGDSYGIANVLMFGALGDGVADDTAAIQRSIQSAAGGIVWLPPGTYRTTGLVIPQDMTVRLVGVGSGGVGGTTLKASGPDPVITVSTVNAGGAAAHIAIESMRIDGNNKTAPGLRILKTQNFVARDVTFRFCSTGVHIDGTANMRVLNAAFHNCITEYNTVGVLIERPQPVQTTSFTNFFFVSHASESDGTAIKSVGDLLIDITGGELQNSTVATLDLDESRANLQSVWVEAHPDGRHAVLKNGATMSLRHCIMADKIDVDSTSYVVAESSTINGYGLVSTRQEIGRTSRVTSWGPPNWPDAADKLGAHYAVGWCYEDGMRVKWQCTEAGSSQAARFIAPEGRIVIPLDGSNPNFNNGMYYWAPNEDFVLTDVTLVVSTSFVPNTATKLSVGYPTPPYEQFISFAQGAAGNLVSGAVIHSRSNEVASAALTLGKELLLSRSSVVEIPTAVNRMCIYTDGTWTSGLGYLVIRGYYLP